MAWQLQPAFLSVCVDICTDTSNDYKVNDVCHRIQDSMHSNRLLPYSEKISRYWKLTASVRSVVNGRLTSWRAPEFMHFTSSQLPNPPPSLLPCCLYITVSNVANCPLHCFASKSLGVSSTTFTQQTVKATKFGEITQNKSYYAIPGHSRSPILVQIESSYSTSNYWLILTYLLSCSVFEI